MWRNLRDAPRMFATCIGLSISNSPGPLVARSAVKQGPWVGCATQSTYTRGGPGYGGQRQTESVEITPDSVTPPPPLHAACKPHGAHPSMRLANRMEPWQMDCRSAIPLVPLWPGPPLNRVPGSTAQRSRPTPAVDLGTEGCSRRSRLRLLPTPSAKKIWFGFSPGEI